MEEGFPASQIPGRQPPGSPWGQVVPALWLFGLSAAGALAMSLLSGAYSALLMSRILGGSDLPTGEWVTWAFRLTGLGVSAMQIVALAFLARSAPQIRSIATVALALAAADFVLGLGTDLGWALNRGGNTGLIALLQAVGWLSLPVAIVGEALGFETVLKVRREASGGSRGQDGTLRGVYWAGWGPRALMWIVMMAGVRLPPWPMYAARVVLSLVICGAVLAAVRYALLAAQAPADAPAGGFAPAPAAGPGGSEADRMSGLRNLGLGMLWMVIGGGVTAWTYASASATGGGRYVVAYGAIAAGLVQAVAGMVQLLRGK